MFDELERSFAARERFAANASHELRTPVATTTLLIDVAREQGIVTDPNWLERLDSANIRTTDLITSLLMLADSTSATISKRPVDLAVLARESVAELSEQTLPIHLDMDLRPSMVSGDELLLGRLAGNLIDNAVKHNIENGFVSVRTYKDGDAGVLEVANSGIELDPTTIQRLSEPFYRNRGRLSTSTMAAESHGLGLALVAAIIDSHGGELQLRPRPGGGLIVTARLSATNRPGLVIRGPSRSDDPN